MWSKLVVAVALATGAIYPFFHYNDAFGFRNPICSHTRDSLSYPLQILCRDSTRHQWESVFLLYIPTPTDKTPTMTIELTPAPPAPLPRPEAKVLNQVTIKLPQHTSKDRLQPIRTRSRSAIASSLASYKQVAAVLFALQLFLGSFAYLCPTLFTVILNIVFPTISHISFEAILVATYGLYSERFKYPFTPFYSPGSVSLMKALGSSSGILSSEITYLMAFDGAPTSASSGFGLHSSTFSVFNPSVDVSGSMASLHSSQESDIKQLAPVSLLVGGVRVIPIVPGGTPLPIEGDELECVSGPSDDIPSVTAFDDDTSTTLLRNSQLSIPPFEVGSFSFDFVAIACQIPLPDDDDYFYLLDPVNVPIPDDDFEFDDPVHDEEDSDLARDFIYSIVEVKTSTPRTHQPSPSPSISPLCIAQSAAVIVDEFELDSVHSDVLEEGDETDGEFDRSPYERNSSNLSLDYVYLPWDTADVASAILDVPLYPLGPGLCEEEILDAICLLVDELRSLPLLEEENAPVSVSDPIVPLDLTRAPDELDAIINSCPGVRARGEQSRATSARRAPQSRLWQNALRSTHVNREGRTRARGKKD